MNGFFRSRSKPRYATERASERAKDSSRDAQPRNRPSTRFCIQNLLIFRIRATKNHRKLLWIYLFRRNKALSWERNSLPDHDGTAAAAVPRERTRATHLDSNPVTAQSNRLKDLKAGDGGRSFSVFTTRPFCRSGAHWFLGPRAPSRPLSLSVLLPRLFRLVRTSLRAWRGHKENNSAFGRSARLQLSNY